MTDKKETLATKVQEATAAVEAFIAANETFGATQYNLDVLLSHLQAESLPITLVNLNHGWKKLRARPDFEPEIEEPEADPDAEADAAFDAEVSAMSSEVFKANLRDPEFAARANRPRRKQ